MLKMSRIAADKRYRSINSLDLKGRRNVETLLNALKHSPNDLTDAETTTSVDTSSSPLTDDPTKPIEEISTLESLEVNDSDVEAGSVASSRNRKHAELPDNLVDDSKDFRYQDNRFSSVANDYEFDALMRHSVAGDYSDLFTVLKPTSEDLLKYGHQAEEMILQCSFDTQNCSYKDFYRRENSYYGNCFTFNHGFGSPTFDFNAQFNDDLDVERNLRDTNTVRMDGFIPHPEHRASPLTDDHSLNEKESDLHESSLMSHLQDSAWKGNADYLRAGFHSEEIRTKTPVQGHSSNKYGSRYGLRLTLNIEQDEYLGLFSHRGGVRVAIHANDVVPFPEDFGLNASPGFETQIGITKEHVIRIPYPYPSNCTNRHSYPGAGADEGYTVMACMKSCMQRKLELYCGCVDSEVTSSEASYLRCRSTNYTQENCRQKVRYLFENKRQSCNCPPPCSEIIYKSMISSTIWPSDTYATLLATALNETSAYKADVIKRIRQNFVSVHIYLAEMNVRRIEEHPSYPWDRLLADVGGMLGLFIGISACTVMELLEFLFDAVSLAVSKCRNTNSAESPSRNNSETRSL